MAEFNYKRGYANLSRVLGEYIYYQERKQINTEKGKHARAMFYFYIRNLPARSHRHYIVDALRALRSREQGRSVTKLSKTDEKFVTQLHKYWDRFYRSHLL